MTNFLIATLIISIGMAAAFLIAAILDAADDRADRIANRDTTHSEVVSPTADRGDAPAVFGGVPTNVSSFHASPNTSGGL
jgi:hypothetical protein